MNRQGRLRGVANRWVSSLCRSVELLAARARHSCGQKPAPVKLLILSDGLSAQSEAQFDPIFRNRGELLRRYGLIVEHIPLDVTRPPTVRQLAGFDLIAFKLYYKTKPAVASQFAAHLRAVKSPASVLIYCDGNDEMTIQWPDLLRHCDLYWKKHVFRERSLYLRRFRGGTNLTDYALGDGADYREEQVPAEESLLRKVVPGYSIGLDRKIAALAPMLDEKAGLPSHSERKYDVVLRADVPDNWMGRLRRPAVEALRRLDDRFRILLPSGRVSKEQYQEEMRQSRVCVSPFGYGEICWRDFEAVLHGCLLLKPDMGHVRSRPDIFQPFVTYVPLAWDFSDLPEKLAHYLANPEAAAKIAENAHQVMASALQPDWFCEVFEEVLRAAQSARTPAVPPAGSDPQTACSEFSK